MDKTLQKSLLTRAQNSFIWSMEGHFDIAIVKERFMNVKKKIESRTA